MGNSASVSPSKDKINRKMISVDDESSRSKDDPSKPQRISAIVFPLSNGQQYQLELPPGSRYWYLTSGYSRSTPIYVRNITEVLLLLSQVDDTFATKFSYSCGILQLIDNHTLTFQEAELAYKILLRLSSDENVDIQCNSLFGIAELVKKEFISPEFIEPIRQLFVSTLESEHSTVQKISFHGLQLCKADDKPVLHHRNSTGMVSNAESDDDVDIDDNETIEDLKLNPNAQNVIPSLIIPRDRSYTM